MQPPSTARSNNASPDLGTACPPKRYVGSFASLIVQKSRRHARQPRGNEVGRRSIEHRTQFADLRALAGGEAESFQSRLEELSNVPLAVDDANARHNFSSAIVDGR
jgi:hypothetical protein